MVAAGTAIASGEPSMIRDNRKRIQGLVDEFRGRLDMPHEVVVSIVPRNALLVSVEPTKDRRGAFLLSFERDFVDLLSDDELEAVVAHELGHVWIFTHHPYLQTEGLANQIAMRLVSRNSLAHVYDKVWKHDGDRGDLARFLGEPPLPPATGSGRVGSSQR